MTDWPAVIPPTAVVTAMMRLPQQTAAKRVIAPADSGNIGNDTKNRHSQSDAQTRHPVVVPPQPDTDRPTGPPPAFEANVLEAQAERRRSKTTKTATDLSEVRSDHDTLDAGSIAGRSAEGPDSQPVPDKTGTGPYSGLPALADPRLDLIR